MQKKRSYIVLLVFVVLCFMLSGCQQERQEPLSGVNQSSGPGSESQIAELLNAMNMYGFETLQEAPSFELYSVYGEEVSLRQFRGKVVLLSFWASW